MTLAFSTELEGQPTHFVEKIWEGLLNAKLELCLWDISNYVFQSPQQIGTYVLGSLKPKFHTIRKDEKDRWKEGQDIHMVIHNRTPERFQFAPIVKCRSIQVIKITWEVIDQEETMAKVHIGDRLYGYALYKNCKLHIHSGVRTLALNDGFESVEDFFNYFDKDLVGKIIHWTNLKY